RTPVLNNYRYKPRPSAEQERALEEVSGSEFCFLHLWEQTQSASYPCWGIPSPSMNRLACAQHLGSSQQTAWGRGRRGGPAASPGALGHGTDLRTANALSTYGLVLAPAPGQRPCASASGTSSPQRERARAA